MAIIQQGGSPAYVREGRVYEGGMFGGDLEAAVRGNAAAEAHARSYKSGMVGGFVTSILGAAGLGAGLVVLAAGTHESGPSSTGGGGLSEGQTIGTAVFVGGVVAYVTGFVLMLNAQPHLLDAVNVYNDGLLAPAPFPVSARVPVVAAPPSVAAPPAVAAPPPAVAAPTPGAPPPPAAGGESAPSH